MNNHKKLISIPLLGDKSDSDIKNELENSIHLNISAIKLPNFKFDNLSNLLNLVESFSSFDRMLKNLIRKLVEVKDQLGLNDDDLSLVDFHYNYDQSNEFKNLNLNELVNVTKVNLEYLDNQLKSNLNDFNKVENELKNLNKLKNLNLTNKPLNDFINNNNYLDTSYITTLFLVVNKNDINDWFNSYEKLSNMIIPRSSIIISSDDNYHLVNVLVFKKFKDNFIQACQKRKFLVRNFSFDQSYSKQDSVNNFKKLENTEYSKFNKLKEFLKFSSNQIISNYFKVNFIKLYIESVLTYGLPINYAYLLIENDINSKQLQSLVNHFNQILPNKSNFNSINNNNNIETNLNSDLLNLLQQPYYPFPYIDLNFNGSE